MTLIRPNAPCRARANLGPVVSAFRARNLQHLRQIIGITLSSGKSRKVGSTPFPPRRALRLLSDAMT